MSETNERMSECALLVRMSERASKCAPANERTNE